MQLVVVSPLIRALETAAGVFGLDAAEATEAHLAQQAGQAEGQQDAAQQQGQQGEQQEGGNGAQGDSKLNSNGGEAESMDTDPPPLLMRAQVRAGRGPCHLCIGVLQSAHRLQCIDLSVAKGSGLSGRPALSCVSNHKVLVCRLPNCAGQGAQYCEGKQHLPSNH